MSLLGGHPDVPAGGTPRCPPWGDTQMSSPARTSSHGHATKVKDERLSAVDPSSP